VTMCFDDGFASELVLVSAADDAALLAEVSRLEAFLQQAPDALLRDVAYTCSLARGPAVLAVVSSTVNELRGRLALARGRLVSGATRIRDRSGTYYSGVRAPAKTAFLVPGAASFYPDMLRDIILAYPRMRVAFDELEEALAGSGPFQPSSFVFPPAACYRRDAEVFSAGGYAEAVVSVASASAAVIRFLAAAGLRADGYAGFGGGDLVALACSGAFGDMNRASRQAFVRDVYALSARVVKGMPEPDWKQLVLDAEWCAKFDSDFRKFAQRWIKQMPSLPVYSCATAAPIGPKTKDARAQSAALWTSAVDFAATLRRMHADGYRTFVEAGPRSLFSTAAKEALRGLDCEIVTFNRAHRSGLVQMQHALGLLAALGHPVDPAPLFEDRRAHRLDFDAPLSLEARADSKLKLSRAFPRMTYQADEPEFVKSASVTVAEAAPGQRGKRRAESLEARKRRKQQQFDFGAAAPLISDAQATLDPEGASIEIVKTFTLKDAPFFAETAVGASQLSYSDSKLRGYVPLTLLAAAEILAETASRLVPNRQLLSIEGLETPQTLAFAGGALALRVRAERVVSTDEGRLAVRASLRVDDADAAVKPPVVSATFAFADGEVVRPAFAFRPLKRPRDVHWTARDVYPARLAVGETLQCVRRADMWSEEGLDYEIEAPDSGRAVAHTSVPVWTANPLLLEAVSQGFALWRSHARFAGAFSYPFRVRRIDFHAQNVPAGTRLKCYLRLTDVTPKTQVADIQVTGGDGNLLFALHGYEEMTERVPEEYVKLVLSPATAFLTEKIGADKLGSPVYAFASALITDVPYPIFERNEGLWLKTVSQIALNASERRKFSEMTGSTARRTEWLFGRLAAKEAVRRYLLENHQARWMDADVEIWANEKGKPCAVGAWADNLSTRLDLAISHTADFVVAIVASKARVGVDAERVTRDLSSEFTAGAFESCELELAATGVDVAAATIRFWCAKEAVSKALGTGLRYSPRALQVTAFDLATGALEVTLTGDWLEAFKQFRGLPVKVSTVIVRNHVLATCFIPETLVRDE